MKKKKSVIKKVYTSLRYRMISISLSVFVFILVMVAALLVELYNNQENYMKMYENQQQKLVEMLAKELVYHYGQGQTDEDIVAYLGKEIEASGSHFFVLSKDQEVLFAKNSITTKCLGSLSDKTAFYKSITQQDVTIQKTEFTVKEQKYEISVISDVYTVKAEGNLDKHQYTILLGVAIMSLVLVSLLVTMLGSWNRTEQQLDGTRKELDIRNEKIEQISQETGSLIGDKTDVLTREEVTGVIKSDKAEFYNIYTLKMLLQKSEDESLKPLQIIFLNIVLGNRYFTKDEIFGAMERIHETLRPVEVMGEIKRGKFAILAYRTSPKEMEKRMKELKRLCDEIEKEDGMKIECVPVLEDERTAIERFEAQ